MYNKNGNNLKNIENQKINSYKVGSLGMTEPSSGSDALSMKTSATMDKGNFILNGSKTCITNAPYADIFLVYARTGENITPFVVESSDSGFSRGQEFDKTGMRGSPTGTIHFFPHSVFLLFCSPAK